MTDKAQAQPSAQVDVRQRLECGYEWEETEIEDRP